MLLVRKKKLFDVSLLKLYHLSIQITPLKVSYLFLLGDTSDNEFKLQCKKDLGAGVIGFDPPNPWPSCKEPPVTTTIDPNAPTTPKPLPPCQCIGDIPIPQAQNILNKFCRNYTIEGNMLIMTAGDEGSTPPSRRRCGSRNPDTPELSDHCYCSGVDKQASRSLIKQCFVMNKYELLHTNCKCTEM